MSKNNGEVVGRAIVHVSSGYRTLGFVLPRDKALQLWELLAEADTTEVNWDSERKEDVRYIFKEGCPATLEALSHAAYAEGILNAESKKKGG